MKNNIVSYFVSDKSWNVFSILNLRSISSFRLSSLSSNLGLIAFCILWVTIHSEDTDVILTKEASHSCRFVPGTNWYKWASQIVNFTLIHHLSVSDKMAWPVVSVCSLVYEQSTYRVTRWTFSKMALFFKKKTSFI